MISAVSLIKYKKPSLRIEHVEMQAFQGCSKQQSGCQSHVIPTGQRCQPA